MFSLARIFNQHVFLYSDFPMIVPDGRLQYYLPNALDTGRGARDIDELWSTHNIVQIVTVSVVRDTPTGGYYGLDHDDIEVSAIGLLRAQRGFQHRSAVLRYQHMTVVE